MTPEQVRKIVRQEIYNGQNAQRFGGINAIPNHHHDGIDSLPINANNIVPSSSIMGSVTFAQTTTYTIRLNASFTPRQVQVFGIVTGSYSGQQTRVQVIGHAQLTPTFYLQDPTSANTPDTYVITGELQYPYNGKPAQSSSYISVTRGGTSNFYAGTSEDHICSVYFPSTSDIHARATITGFSKTEITIDVPFLDSGWEITLNYVIT